MGIDTCLLKIFQGKTGIFPWPVLNNSKLVYWAAFSTSLKRRMKLPPQIFRISSSV